MEMHGKKELDLVVVDTPKRLELEEDSKLRIHERTLTKWPRQTRESISIVS